MSEPVLSVRNLASSSRRGAARWSRSTTCRSTSRRARFSASSANPGAGKSLTGAAIIGLLEPPGRIAGGEVRLNGQRIDNLPPEEMRQIRGRRIGMVFQDPLTSLNPLYRIGDQIIETIRTHSDISERQRASAPSPCCTKSASRARGRASTATRTSSRAACASASCWPSRSAPSPNC